MNQLKKILYVEDDEDILFISKMVFAKTEYEVHYCISGMEAIQIAQRWRPDLVLLDMMMPGIDGIETFKQLNSIFTPNAPPVIFMTAKVQATEIQEYIDLGGIGVIPKPFDPLTLIKEVETLYNHPR